MKRLGLAWTLFWRILKDAAFAQHLETVVGTTGTASLSSGGGGGRRPDAVALLALLQREGRLLDFAMESIDGFSDAQVGAAARSVHRSCREVLQRVFAPRSAIKQGEGISVPVAAGYDPGRYTLTGNVAGKPPFKGVVCHPGWEATRVELPGWSGRPESALVIVPAEIEVK